MTPIQGLQAFDPSTDPLGIGLKQRAAVNQQPYPGFGPLPDPQWEGFFQAMNEAGVDKIGGGQSPAGSNQLTGTQTPTDFSGTETYGGNKGPTYLGSTPPSAAASPWGLGGTGPSAAMLNPPGIPSVPNPNRLTEPSAPITGLQAAKPMKKSTIQPLAGR